MRVAIVHDYLNQYGGAEKVVEALHEVFPEAPIYTSIFLPRNLPAHFSTWDVRPSFMQSLPFLDRHFKKYAALYPRAVESLDLSGYDVVLSSSSAFAKGARKAPGAVHICYCYTPMRFAWTPESYFEREGVPFFLRPFLPPLLASLKKWDLATAGRVDHYVAITRHIQERIRRAYGRDAEVIYPPVDVRAFSPSAEVEDYYLIVSRLNAYKRIDLAVEALTRLGRPLRVIGGGPHADVLRRAAGRNVTFLGRVPQEDLPRHFARCRAFIFPGEEDFGIAPVEAMAAGRPVIAFRAGGALETVVEGETGVFFDQATPESLMDGVRRFEAAPFDPARCRRRAEAFDKSVFQSRIQKFVEEKARERAE